MGWERLPLKFLPPNICHNELEPLHWNSNSEVHYSAENVPTTIFTDNTAARQVAQNPVFHKRMKHTHIRHHFVRNLVLNKIVRYQFTYSPDNNADMMVKALAKALLRKHRKTVFGPFVPPAVVLTPEEQLAAKSKSGI